MKKKETTANTVFVAHFVRSNWLMPTSRTPETLYEIALRLQI
jgi:hypothetical protein